MRQRFLKLAAATALVISIPSLSPAQTGETDALHQQILALDGHADILLPSTPARYRAPDGGSRVSLPRLNAGGVDAIVLSLAVGPGPRDAAGISAARAEVNAKLTTIREWIAADPERAGLAHSADDVERLRFEGRIAVLISFQNARSIGADISLIDALYRDGVRIFAFNHAGHNDFSDSSRPWNEPVAEHGGLSPLGREAVARLNDLGVLIDVSQLSTDALLQTLQLTRAPVAATHSNARALIDNGRNLSDRELDAIRANGGVVQVTPFSAYLRDPGDEYRRRVGEVRVRFGLSEAFRSATDGATALPDDRQEEFTDAVYAVRPARATLSDYVDHIDYIARRIGWQHVGIGTDFDHGSGVDGFDSAAEAPNVTRELIRRGYSEEQIAAIWSGNFLRVLRAAETVARR